MKAGCAKPERGDGERMVACVRGSKPDLFRDTDERLWPRARVLRDEEDDAVLGRSGGDAPGFVKRFAGPDKGGTGG